MPRRDDIESILIIGSGPIVIGQACEFDYSGTQACRVLREEGYRVILANSNPATIMTDPGFADATYVEPLSHEALSRIVERERPDALLPTLGGQTALNLAMGLAEGGVLEAHGCEMIGASPEAIACAEDRERFKAAMVEIGLAVPASMIARSLEEAMAAPETVGLPVIVRPAYILGGRGTGMASTVEELAAVATEGLAASPISEILIERSIAGWKEFELEVMRDRADNCVVICSIENFDAMGVHTGDSITVAPAQTLSDIEYQQMRDAAFACIRRIGVETGGSNIQFAVDPADGSQVVIEMNPRVSRSSALASKATGFPIAKIAARLAVGYTLDEIPNDITRKTPAAFEPTIDYVVTKVPRWNFEKFPGARSTLGTSMQSVGEVMAIGRTFCESLQKALRSLELGRAGLNCDPAESAYDRLDDAALLEACAVATPERVFQLEAALRRGLDTDELYAASGVDPWFLEQMRLISAERDRLAGVTPEVLNLRDWRGLKRLGFSDAQMAYLWGCTAGEVRRARLATGVGPTFKTVDTCGAEFAAETPYHYSTFEDSDEVAPSDRPKVVILGSGPNRIGQGIEFDYCCVHAAQVLGDAGYETVMVNCNPETVSTDYDTSDRLYFEPLTTEDVLAVLGAEERSARRGGGPGVVGVIVGLGGQTPLKLAGELPPGLVAGTSPAAIDAAEDREQWGALCRRLGVPQPPGDVATSADAAREVARRIGYPVLVRPSYVLGGRAMVIVHDDEELAVAMTEMSHEGSLGREGGLSAERPVLVDRFLEDAVEVDVDAVRDRAGSVLIGGVMEHVEEAGVHSGDSACLLPPVNLPAGVIEALERHTRAIADELQVVGLLNVQYAVPRGPDGSLGGPDGRSVFVLEANPRASRTVPFVAKATGVPLVKLATLAMMGRTLAALAASGSVEGWTGPAPAPGSYEAWRPPEHISVKEAVLPFNRFPGVDAVLGPEMRCTGEVMGIDRRPGLAFAKSQIAAGAALPTSGSVFLSLADRDKQVGITVARRLAGMGFTLLATRGTAAALAAAGVGTEAVVAKLADPEGPHAVTLLDAGRIDLVINTPQGRGPRADGADIRRVAAQRGVPLLTTVAAALAATAGIADQRNHPMEVRSLQEYHRDIRESA
ncbi:MAG: carbamoyl-phosphate synthase large subunit [bacterium]|nr:carbamoyl-phosphate synthase large subunit [bacterium]